MKKALLSAIALSLLAVQPALARDEKVSVQQRGTNSVTLTASTNSAGIGYWYKFSDKISLGGDFSIYYNGDDRSDYQNYSFSPAVKYYLMPEKTFSPYLFGGLVGSYGRNTTDASANSSQSSSENYAAGATAGIGLEWFIIQNVSIGGHVGATAQYRYAKSRATFFSGSSIAAASSVRNEGFATGTFNSGIRLNLFF